MIAENTAADAPLRLFWQPGCSSCVKLKEYLASIEVPFDSVNILEDGRAMDELLARGIRSVPVLIQGERMTYGQSLDDVAAFVGRRREAEPLPPRVLLQRWLTFLAAARELITRIPPDRLEVRPVPERPRTTRELATHIFQIPESVLEGIEGGLKDTREISNAKFDHIRTPEQLLDYADRVSARLRRWSANVEDGWFETRIATYYGEQPATGVLERGTWHSGQHARQLDRIVHEVNGTPEIIPPETYEGLPMPRGLWQ